MKQVQEAYIVAAVRTPIGKAPRGMFKNVRPDDMLAHVLRAAMAQVPGVHFLHAWLLPVRIRSVILLPPPTAAAHLPIRILLFTHNHL